MYLPSGGAHRGCHVTESSRCFCREMTVHSATRRGWMDRSQKSPVGIGRRVVNATSWAAGDCTFPMQRVRHYGSGDAFTLIRLLPLETNVVMLQRRNTKLATTMRLTLSARASWRCIFNVMAEVCLPRFLQLAIIDSKMSDAGLLLVMDQLFE